MRHLYFRSAVIRESYSKVFGLESHNSADDLVKLARKVINELDDCYTNSFSDLNQMLSKCFDFARLFVGLCGKRTEHRITVDNNTKAFSELGANEFCDEVFEVELSNGEKMEVLFDEEIVIKGVGLSLRLKNMAESIKATTNILRERAVGNGASLVYPQEILDAVRALYPDGIKDYPPRAGKRKRLYEVTLEELAQEYRTLKRPPSPEY
ncbi:partial [Paramuricea clavata]|uniref:Partial n=1 Tax=Paramuricea clavata TaxID=317549 RepID=A0A7D9IE78_PARCT|nr:partial [Paramuricea clavata]